MSQLLGRLRQENRLNLGGGGLQWAEIALLHASLGNRVRLCLKKKKKEHEATEYSTNLKKNPKSFLYKNIFIRKRVILKGIQMKPT